MQKIIPHLWFDNQALEAARFYTSIFPNSSIGENSEYPEAGQEIHHQEAGSVMTVEFSLAGTSFLALNAGPIFKFNPSISFFVHCKDAEEVNTFYAKLSEGGEVLMELGSYPFSERYAWIADKYGVTWQLSVAMGPVTQMIVPSLLFTQKMAGRAEEAIKLYTSIFPDSQIEMVSRYGEGMEPNDPQSLNYASFVLCGQKFSAMDSSNEHKFVFNEAISLLVNCEDQEEIDMYWKKLSADPQSEQCGWIKDTFGVSWQIVPANMGELMSSGTKEQNERVMAAMLQMKKLDIAALKRAAQG